MKPFTRRRLLGAGLCAAVCAGLGPRAALAVPAGRKYACPPCGCASDGILFDEPGICPACGMRLDPIDVEGSVPAFEPHRLGPGSGAFLARGGKGREDKRIAVHYYRPAGFTSTSPILLVIPGTGRNGGDYRDGWLEAADANSVLVAALSYPESDYDFAAYHMGGVIRNLQLRNLPTGPDGRIPASLHMRDEDITFELNDRPDEWLFNDFDRIFDMLVSATGSSRSGYDLFGHSAGGQILHRLPLFHPHSRAQRIIAANSGFYTLPSFEVPLPFGLMGTGRSERSLVRSFASDLTIMLGELDNDPEAGGQHLHTPLVDRQGLDRLSRGRHFFEAGRREADRLGAGFAWSLEVVAGVGHDHRGMARAAARRLYGEARERS